MFNETEWKSSCLHVTNMSSIKNTWKETAHCSGAEGHLLSCLLTSGCVISTLYTDVLRLSDTWLLLVKADQLQASSSHKLSCQVSMVQLLCSGSEPQHPSPAPSSGHTAGTGHLLVGSVCGWGCQVSCRCGHMGNSERTSWGANNLCGEPRACEYRQIVRL